MAPMAVRLSPKLPSKYGNIQTPLKPTRAARPLKRFKEY
jgi:hypothetical protein